MTNTPRRRDGSERDYALGMAIAVGAGLGMLFGLLLDNVAIGTTAGAVVGLLTGLAIQAQTPTRHREP